MSENADKLRNQVSALAKFGGQALRSSEIGELLQEATLLVSDAIDVDLVKVLELLPGGQNLLVRAGVNWNPGVVGQATIPADGGSAAGHAYHRSSEHVRLCWRERGVVIERDPVKRGYGSEILERSIPDMLEGTLDRTFHPDGIECVIEFGVES